MTRGLGIDMLSAETAPSGRLRFGSASKALQPSLDPVIEGFLREAPDHLHALVGRHGSPLNVVWPHAVAENVARMRRVFATHGVAYEIFYGAKVNKSQALIRAAVNADIGVDASSLAEFQDALRAGLDPARACATGPAKTTAFHRALIAAGALIAVDSLEELDDLARAAVPRGRVRVLLRYRPASAGASRFGMGREAIATALHRIAGSKEAFAFEGFHTHLGGYAVESRITAIRDMAALVTEARSIGLDARMIDIGGGLPVRYVSPDAYANALHSQRAEDYRGGKVPVSFYPYGTDKTAPDWIDDLLRAPCRGGTIAGYLRAEGLTLAIEPGRSLVDQAAISAFRVTRVKSVEGGIAIVFVEGSSFSACETWFASEFLIDPILLSAMPREPDDEHLRAYIAGHSCLDEDVITNRLLDFGVVPRPGDLLIFANTAGYQMDLLENEFHRHPMPTRLVARVTARRDLVFVQDR